MNSIIVIFLLSLLRFSHAFLPKHMTQIQNIISSKAIATGVMTVVSEEIIGDNLVVRELLFHNKNDIMDVVYFGLLVATIVNKKSLEYTYYKWNNLDGFSTIEKKTRLFFLVVMIVFNRNVENAI